MNKKFIAEFRPEVLNRWMFSSKAEFLFVYREFYLCAELEYSYYLILLLDPPKFSFQWNSSNSLVNLNSMVDGINSSLRVNSIVERLEILSNSAKLLDSIFIYGTTENNS